MNRWIAASRPKTLVAACAPVTLGVAYAASLQNISYLTACFILIDALLIQVVTNFANDVIDFERGADTAERVGPQRMTQSGLITSTEMWFATFFLLLCAAVIGLYLVWLGGVPILLIGVSALILSLAYTGGPFPLAYNGLGDVFTLFYFGPVALGGTVYLLLGYLPLAALGLGLSCGLLATAFLLINNTRDTKSDSLANKRTLIVMFGTQLGKSLYVGSIFTAIFIPVLLSQLNIIPGSLSFLVVLALPASLLSSRMVRAEHGEQYNNLLASTGMFYWLFLVSSIFLLR
jgi:1,4-dihydroxy-2-naphthoate polyprenyltransferase